MRRLFAAAMCSAIAVFYGLGTANATITVSGDIGGGTVPGVGEIAIDGSTTDFVTFTRDVGGRTETFSATVIARNIGGTRFELEVTNLNFTTEWGGELSMRIQQDYTMLFSPANAAATHRFAGEVNFNAPGQSVTLVKPSTHEGTTLPTLADFAIALGGPPFVPQAIIAGPLGASFSAIQPYTIDTTYTFDITGAADGLPVRIEMPPPQSGLVGGLDVGEITPIPEPTSLLLITGTCGMLLVVQRRRCS
jgi:hypothetical protein